MQKPEFLNFEPTYDPRPYAEIPKVRGVIYSLIIAFLIWILASVLLSITLFVAGNLWVFLLDGHLYKYDRSSLQQACLAIFGLALFIEFVAHGSAYIAFLGARTWPSLPKVVLFAMFGKRIGAGNGTGRINRINIMGY